MLNPLESRAILKVGDQDYTLFRLEKVYESHPNARRLPYSLKVLLENLLRGAADTDKLAVSVEDVAALADWSPPKPALPQVGGPLGAAVEAVIKPPPPREIAFMPARVLLQDFTGVPAVVDFAAMRDAMRSLGGDPVRINPLLPAELVIDHSVQVDHYGNPEAFALNERLEFARNQERYLFLRWGQKAFRNFQVVPPDTGIVHQVNLEFLARVVFVAGNAVTALAPTAPLVYPDTLVGTDSHTTMINGLGVLGW